MMKKTITILALFAVVGLMASSAMADPTDYYAGRANWEQIPGYYQGGGGEFTIRPDGPPGLYLNNLEYADVTRNQGDWDNSFQTFCVEIGEGIQEPMDVYVSETWTNNVTNPQWDPKNPHDPRSHAIKGGEAVGDDLNPGTAYIYTMFAKGLLSGYQYSSGDGSTHSSSGLTRAESAGALQRLIWRLEDEDTGFAYGDTFMSIVLTDDQKDQITAWEAEIGTANWTDIGMARVLNTYKAGSTTDNRQDQLYIPAPAAVILGLMGLSVVGVWMRKRA